MISIITPHYNNLEGLKVIHSCLLKQTNMAWEWIVVDDFSDGDVVKQIVKWQKGLEDKNLKFIYNKIKTNASFCRNIGINESQSNLLVFLDSDDYISDNFVQNRLIKVEEFTVFGNYHKIFDQKEKRISCISISNYLERFLAASFIWQTTCVLWDKEFLIKIGKFDQDLERLQDVELSIRALYLGKNFKVVDNQVDFFYTAKPIRSKGTILRKSCISVNHLISKISENYMLEEKKFSLLSSYYFACVRVLHRTRNVKEISYIFDTLKLFYKKKYIDAFRYLGGYNLLFLYKYRLITNDLFLKANRYLFKKNTI